MTISLSQVRSYEYMIGGNVGDAGYQQAIANSPVDMVIAGAGQGDLALNRAVADPTNSKLIIGYINTSEAYAYDDPNLFASGKLPSWFGNPNPAYNGIYTVQFWNPAWETQIFNKIDALAKAGYNGVFLDVLSGDEQWAAGNVEGNPVYAGATAAMAKLITDINAHVDSLNLGHPFYLIGNQPTNVAAKDPAALSSLDGVFNEVLNYSASNTDGFTVSNIGTSMSNFVSSTLAPAYTAAGLKVFGNDYAPLTDLNAQFQSFEYYTERGWTPSNQQIHQTSGIMTSGPFMFMATPDASTVQGSANYVNFLSGGLTTSATLIGGNKGDFFIGGPGQNTIKGGAGNDMIYAHPESAGVKSVLQLQFIGDVIGASALPQVTVKINGQVASGPVSIHNTWQNGTTTQEVDIDTKSFGVIKSIEIDGVGIKWTSAGNYNDLYLNGASFNGQAIDLSHSTLNSTAQFASSGRSILMSHDAVINLAVPAAAPALNTSDVIDGGAGTNTVVYRGDYNEYTVAKNADGSLTVTAHDTAEGPDTLRNVQYLQFADQKVATTTWGVSATSSVSAAAPTAPATVGQSATAAHPADTTAPVPVVSNITTDSHGVSTITGHSEAGSTVKIFMDLPYGQTGTPIGTVTADASGNWSFTGLNARGYHAFTETAVDQAGNVGASKGAAMWGQTGNFAISSGAGDDVMLGNGGDTLTGGGGRDTFVFNQNFGKEVVTDFDAKSETIAFDHRMFSSFNDVMSHAYQSGTSVVISHDSANVITLQHATLSSLTAADFLFV